MQDEGRAEQTADGSARSPRWPVVAVGLMLIAFGVVMWQRNVIRAHWWATRLAAVEELDAPETGEWPGYVAAIAATGADGLGAARRLASHERTTIRILAVHLFGRLAPDHGVADLARLLRDADRDVREAAALALAFCGAPRCTEALIGASRDSSGEIAAAALSGLARCDDAASWEAICKAAGRHDAALARAQAAEAIMQRLHGGGRGRAPDADRCAPFEVLVAMLDDGGRFDGRLALEREIERVSAAVARRPEAGLRTVDGTATRAATRAVADVAANCLAQLTGLAVAADPVPADAIETRAASLRQAWQARSTTQTQPPLPDTVPLPALTGD